MKVLLSFLLVIQVFAGLGGLGLLAANCASLYYVGTALVNGGYESEDVWYRLFLGIYMVAFSVMIVLVELRYERFLKGFPSMRKWYLRGALYLFLACVTLVSTYLVIPGGEEELRIAVKVCAWVVGGIGLVYIFLDALCLRGRAKNQRQKEEGNALV